MGDANRGFNLVHVLAALAAGAECIHAQVFRANVDFDAVVNFRNHEDRSEGGVAAGRLIERRDAHQAVYSGFSRKQAISVFACELDRCGFDTRFFAGSFVQNGGVDTFAFRPSQIHAQEHGGPILRLGAAGSGLDGHDGVEVIGLAGEKRPGF